jgi:hypothetical protein
MDCLRDEQVIGYVLLAATAIIVVISQTLGKWWNFDVPGVPFVRGWTFLACCAAGASAFFLATGYGIMPPGALAGCDQR